MINQNTVIVGCGDVGQRIATALIAADKSATNIIGLVNTQTSLSVCHEIGIQGQVFDLDNSNLDLMCCDKAELFYTVAPQKQGVSDKRTRNLIAYFEAQKIVPHRVVVISTTGVYGDHKGGWVTEKSPAYPQTERGQRRLDSESQWRSWGSKNSVPVTILRVPGIYANSRLPRERIRKRIPVVRPDECGYTNRIHADDLAMVAIAAMQGDQIDAIYNVTDGTPGKISEYLQAAALVLGEEPLPEITMQQAKSELSASMLSYLRESRRISNQKMLDELNVVLRYPDFKEGLKV